LELENHALSRDGIASSREGEWSDPYNSAGGPPETR